MSDSGNGSESSFVLDFTLRDVMSTQSKICLGLFSFGIVIGGIVLRSSLKVERKRRSSEVSWVDHSVSAGLAEE
jgi:hypothetical protein